MNSEEKKYVKLLEEKGYTVKIVKQNKSNTIFEISRNGKKQEFPFFLGSRTTTINESVACVDKIFQLL